MPDDKTRGLYQKYQVTRTDGQSVGLSVVLEFKDPLARSALLVWAYGMHEAGYETVAADVVATLNAYVGDSYSPRREPVITRTVGAALYALAALVAIITALWITGVIK